MRTVPEWRGKTDDSKPTTAVRLRVFEAYHGHCHISGTRINVGDLWDVDHLVPLCLGGLNIESNLAPVLRERHREKSAAEVSAKSKADRMRAKHLGIFPKSRTPLRSRGFARKSSTETAT